MLPGRATRLHAKAYRGAARETWVASPGIHVPPTFLFSGGVVEAPSDGVRLRDGLGTSMCNVLNAHTCQADLASQKTGRHPVSSFLLWNAVDKALR